jgi:hypothetical protein
MKRRWKQIKLRVTEDKIAKDFECSKILTQQLSLTEDSVLKNGCRIATFHPTVLGYFFGGKVLSESHTDYLDYKCPECGQRLRRTKRAIDVGGGVKLYAVCTSILVNRLLSQRLSTEGFLRNPLFGLQRLLSNQVRFP